ncbi:hypothetical protein ABZ589_11965 [Streptomyces sp. NPDC013313]|uniref:hypothetical protein n=1 Tax=Streptomyces sp. NPDC013313 TaxID=3155603 RepID=UPI0033EBA4AB
MTISSLALTPSATKRDGTPSAAAPRRRRHRGLLLGLATTGVALATLAVGTPAFATTSVSIWNANANVRDCYHPPQSYPSTNCTVQATLEARLPVRLVCQYPGQTVSGDAYWDYVLYPATSGHGAGEGYVSDSLVYTGYGSRDPQVPICTW